MVITRLAERMQLSSRLRLALLVVVAGFAFYALLIYTRPFSLLPGYPAVIVAFALWLIAPGWLLQRALFATRTTSLIEQITVAFLMSLALAALPGLVALRLHWSIDAFALSYAALALFASGLSLLWRLDDGEPASGQDAPSVEEEPHQSSLRSHLPLLIMIAVPLLAVATAPWWAGDRIARDFDDTVYMAFVNEYVDGDGLDASVPFQNTRPGQYGRTQMNVWLVMEAVVADSAGVEPFDLLQDYLPPLMTLLVVAAAFTLARGLFGSTPIALLASFIVLLYGAMDLAPHESYGRNIFLRISEDKMVASYILLPIGLLMGVKMLSMPNAARGFLLLLAIAALFVTHPMALIFLGIAMGSLAVLHLLVERSIPATRAAALFIAPWVFVGLGLFASAQLGRDRILLLGVPFRREYHVADVFDGFIVGSYHLILHPFILAAILLAVPLWLISRHNIANQLLPATVAGVLVFVFFPPVATLVADEVNEEAVWRLPWLIPVPLTLAYAVHEAASRFSRQWPDGWAVNGRVLVSTRYAPIAAVAVIAASAFLVQEQYEILDDGGFYNRTSATELLPWTGGSIFLGGVERMFSSDWRPAPVESALLEYLDMYAPPGSMVLLPPEISARFFPGALKDVRAFEYRIGPSAEAKFGKVFAIYNGRIRGTELKEALEFFSIDYVVARIRTDIEELIQAIGGARPDALELLARFEAGDFTIRQGQPTFASNGDRGRSVWSLDPDERELVIASSRVVTIPDGASSDSLEVVVLLEPASDVLEDSVARIVVTLDQLDGQDVIGEPAHAIVDIYLEEATQAGEQLVRFRTPAATFSAGETYQVRVWRDGGHSIDTYAGDVSFVSLEVSWSPEGDPLLNSLYRVYNLTWD